MKKLAAFALITSLATSAAAHSPVDMTNPMDGAIISAVPVEITMNFSNGTRLTRMDMTHQSHPVVELELGEQSGFGHNISVPLESMGTGTYRIEWRGLGEDGHAMRGEFSFTVE